MNGILMGCLEYSESFKYKVMSSAKKANSTSSFFYLACFFSPLLLSYRPGWLQVLSWVREEKRCLLLSFRATCLVFLIEHHRANDKVALFVLRSLGSFIVKGCRIMSKFLLCIRWCDCVISIQAPYYPSWFAYFKPNLRPRDEINTAHVHFPQSLLLF